MSSFLFPAFRRQQLVLDFSSVKDHCPGGLYLSLTPGDASLWAAVLFVRKGEATFSVASASPSKPQRMTDFFKGPYEGAILRFQISFPDTYPDNAPLITLSSDVFHPLVVPLTTYTFTASVNDNSNTVSSSDEDRLPPGAFSLRHGFPAWFQRARWVRNHDEPAVVTAPDTDRPADSGAAPSETSTLAGHNHSQQESVERRTLILNVLVHFQEAFEDEAFLDQLPLEVVGDPSAWHAWRAYRGIRSEKNDSNLKGTNDIGAAPSSPRNPSEWKWDGVWESRVTNAVEASVSEAALFGSTTGGTRAGSFAIDSAIMDPRQKQLAAANRQFRFSKINDEQYVELKTKMSDAGFVVPGP